MGVMESLPPSVPLFCEHRICPPQPLDLSAALAMACRAIAHMPVAVSTLTVGALVFGSYNRHQKHPALTSSPGGR